MTDDLIERVARAWASIDGKAETFDREKAIVYPNWEGDSGTYEGYMTEAEELLKRSGLAALLATSAEKDAEIARLTAERDDALSRAEELEASAETVSAEFEGDCWKALRSLMLECNFDWSNADPDGVTADDAREYISETLSELEKSETRLRARAEAAEAEAAALRERLERAERATHRHKKRGSDYVLLGIGKMQTANWSEHQPKYGEYWRVDMREVAIYRSVIDGQLWVRPREEFDDGRFEEFPRALQNKEQANG